MYAMNMKHWLGYADKALAWECKELALFCLSMAKRHAQMEHKPRSVGHILTAIRYAKQV